MFRDEKIKSIRRVSVEEEVREIVKESIAVGRSMLSAIGAGWRADEPSASRPQIDAIVRQARDEMHRDGRILPYPKLLDILGEAQRLVTASEIVEHHKVLMPPPSVLPNSWGFLERRLARSAEG